MIFKHLVKYNGVYYPAGMNVPVGEIKPVEEKKSEEVKDYTLTKTDINRMSVAELKDLARKESILGADDMTGSEIKKVLINHFNLQELM